ncbi:class II glutamine amidotransferase [Methylocella tundrae]|uniref:Glutamine amidotransferase-like protein GlxB n=1 Tax=Methylocella tundrae TaxID=227605 RepID=A0A4U8Z3L1_METTU|nr:glutamine amidotransferase family protein [Methylocella tundrae]WPP03597.1 glutamine amidotransferase family protein [Methylocella tundrae]WPP03801.1 glutamine amidotransferase family protein [Methylocella tundrae]VFU09966.1 Glutamine amidotransferase-like protein GlxB [Methylocella tundrae]
MCGIVGLFLKDPSLEPDLGRHLAVMLETMTARGPDSAGFAIYGDGSPERIKITLRAGRLFDAGALAVSLASALDGEVDVVARGTHVVVTVAAEQAGLALSAIGDLDDDLTVSSVGSHMELYKEVGLPADVARRFGLSRMSGTHGVGHTRMATESAVTTAGAHPFSTGKDQCLVHNGSLSNHNELRRRLTREGISFATENDSEVAAGYLSWRLAQGESLGGALEASLKDLDGFYTFVVGTDTGFGVLRDPIGCKHAVMAETEQYVAFGTEYRALSRLPGIENARVFEPNPATVYFWDRAA